MLAAGYTDAEFPAWWYTPAREGTAVKTFGQVCTTKEEGAQIGQVGTVGREEETYAPKAQISWLLRELG